MQNSNSFLGTCPCRLYLNVVVLFLIPNPGLNTGPRPFGMQPTRQIATTSASLRLPFAAFGTALAIAMHRLSIALLLDSAA